MITNHDAINKYRACMSKIESEIHRECLSIVSYIFHRNRKKSIVRTLVDLADHGTELYLINYYRVIDLI